MGETRSGLDEILARCDVSERHRLLVRARSDVTYAAFRELTLREVPLAALLFAVRSLPNRLTGHPGLPSTLDEPLLQQFSSRGFSILLDRPGEEIVVGIIGQMWKLHGQVVRPPDIEHFAAFGEPGFVKAAMSFAFTEEGHATRVVTETRVRATDPAALAAFRRYWLLIRPFSGVIRRVWLRGVGARAERVRG